MPAVFLVLVALFGLAIGSFLNVVVFRLNTGRTLFGRSYCFVCSRQLRSHELIPVLSFLIQDGRCRKCRTKISWQYPLVELATALSYVAIVYLFGPTILSIIYAAAFSALIVLFVYDLRHKIIPDGIVYFFDFCALASFFVIHGFTSSAVASMDFLAGPIFFLVFGALWFLSRGKWMGFGDAKLVLGIGWMLGMLPGLTALLIAFWSGAIVGVLLLLIGRARLTMKHEIPFAPFLILGLYVVFFSHVSITSLMALLS